MKAREFLKELHRRNVWKVAVRCVAAAEAVIKLPSLGSEIVALC